MKRFSEPSSSSSSSQSPDSKRQRCSEDSDSASDSESESDAGGCHKGRSELLLTHLSMFPGEELQEDSKAAHNGKSKERIKKLLKEPFCKCKKKCHKAVNFTMVFKLCMTFWSLTKAAQDCVLWGIQNMAADHIMEDESYTGSDSDSSPSGPQSEKSSGQSPKTKQLNCWYIQGRALAGCSIMFFNSLIGPHLGPQCTKPRPWPPHLTRRANLSRSILQDPWHWNVAACAVQEELPRGRSKKVWCLGC